MIADRTYGAVLQHWLNEVCHDDQLQILVAKKKEPFQLGPRGVFPLLWARVRFVNDFEKRHRWAV